MARSKDKSHLPWSIKGISPAAREAAKSAAGLEGVTMGEWVSRAIRRSGGDDAPPPAPQAADLDVAAIEAAIAARVRATEERLLGVVEPLYEIIEALKRRLDRLEQDRGDGTGDTGGER